MVITILPNRHPGRQTNGAPDLDFSNVDATWEQIQESALRAFHSGRLELAARNWERSMAIARRHFGPADPRLAASLTNHGYVLRRRGERFEADRHLRQALNVWDRGWRWVGRMMPGGDPERCYSAAARIWFDALINQGYGATLSIQARDELPEYRLHLWEHYRPATVCDVRRLMSSVLLIASRGRL